MAGKSRPFFPFLPCLFLAGSLFLCGRVPSQGTWKVIAWNDLGMHCMDSDYSVFSILPPFNVLHAQVIDGAGKLVKTKGGLKVTYRAVADPSGSINTTSRGKTNFWNFVKLLYGASPAVDMGLAGFGMPGPSNTPRETRFESTFHFFEAPGIPLTPYDDHFHKRPYPMVRVTVLDSLNRPRGTADVVLPVSDEMDCRLCHASGTVGAARPKAGWVYDPNAERDYRLNILALHDDKRGGSGFYLSALTKAGYSSKGLIDTVSRKRTPILCARCHASNALPGTGIAGIKPLTAAVHGRHALVKDPVTGQLMDSAANRSACYRCHPGSETRCLRGAMGSSVAADGSLAMQCQDCHGRMSDVGASNRQGWLDEPACQECHTGTAVHNNGRIRYTSVFTAPGKKRIAVDSTFATNPDVPSKGYSLYRFSKGHGGLQCEACHGSTHAVYPSSHGNDNVLAARHQGHEGFLVECSSCHGGTSPLTAFGGPHGMHTIGNWWVRKHEKYADHGGYTRCAPCHGSNYRGTVLSRVQADRVLDARKFGTKKFFRGAVIGCYACHKGPKSDHANPNRAPLAANAAGSTVSKPLQFTLKASDPDRDPLTFRILKQPAHGRVALKGSLATYFPDPGFAGTDTFTFAASDGALDSNPGLVTVSRGAEAHTYGKGYPGRNGAVPRLTSRSAPVLGKTLTLGLSNSSGASTAAVLLASRERSLRPTAFGGVLLTEVQVPIGFLLPPSGLQVPWLLPRDPSLVGGRIYVQALEYDKRARFSLSFSLGLQLVLGRF